MDHLTTLIAKRTALYAAMNKDFESFDFQSDIESEDRSTEVEALLDDMRETYERTLQLNDEIEAEMTKMKQNDELITEVTEAKDKQTLNRTRLMKVRKYLHEYVDKKSTNRGTPMKTEVTQKRTAALPKLKLPTFDGTFTQWSSFWDTITADILDAEYADISKFNYIMGQLEGPALEACAGIHPSGENLTTLIALLTERFGQPRKIIRAHINSILDLPNPSYVHSPLNNFYNKIMGHIRSLENLKVNVEECAPFIVTIIEKKLPKIMREKMGTSGQGDRFDLKLFMKTMVAQLDNIGERVDNSVTSPPDQVYSRRNASASTFVGVAGRPRQSQKCLFCNGTHNMFTCPVPPKQKYMKIRAQNKCFNCLGSHRATECFSRNRCRQCGQRHHSCLHQHFMETPTQRTERPAPVTSAPAPTVPAAADVSSSSQNTSS